jgi:hypothetical protein
MKPTIILQILFVTDPTDNHEEVKEMTAEEVFYSIENPSKEDYEVYYTSLERKLKSKNIELQELVAKMENGHLDFYKNQLKAIIKI